MPEGFAFLDLTPSVLLGVTVLLLLTGRLVPRVTLQDKAAEAERWHIAYEKSEEARRLSDAQTQELLEVAHLTHAIINAWTTEIGKPIHIPGAADAPPKT